LCNSDRPITFRAVTETGAFWAGGLERFVQPTAATMETWTSFDFMPASSDDGSGLALLPSASKDGNAPMAGRTTELPLRSDLQVATKQSAQFGAGGDFFEVFQNADGRVSAVVADVCGNGAAAALVAARVRPFLHRSLVRGESPRQVLEALNEGLLRDGPLERFVTAVAIRIDVASGKAEVACAGHLGPFVRRGSGRVQVVERVMGVPLGLIEGEIYQQINLTLSPGDALVLVTDGVTDPLSTDGDPLGEDGLSRRLETAPFLTSGICEALLADGVPNRDDATVLVLRLPETASATIAA
jgi:serine phosphatase RsbU (regulator of sigma subunit)